jgi:Rieske Fe-S protein
VLQGKIAAAFANLENGIMSEGNKSEGRKPVNGTPQAPQEPAKNVLPDRRRFIGWLLGGVGAVVAVFLSIPLIRVSLFPLFAKGATGAEWSDLGPADQYNSLSAPVQRAVKIQNLDGWQQTISEKVVYVTKGPDGQVQVLTAVCPHLGCEVAWDANKDDFHCPCHGSIFAPDGKLVSGPSPRGMDSLPTQVKDGRLMVRYEYFQNLLPAKQVIG